MGERRVEQPPRRMPCHKAKRPPPLGCVLWIGCENGGNRQASVAYVRTHLLEDDILEVLQSLLVRVSVIRLVIVGFRHRTGRKRARRNSRG